MPAEVRYAYARKSLQLVLSAVVGGLVGLVVFVVAQVGGQVLYIVTGAAAGAATALAQRFYARSAVLSEVKVTVPQLSEITFVVNDQGRSVAWQLFIETATRISTQPLDASEGLLREALSSLYGLFGTVRVTLKAGRPSPAVPAGQTVEHLGVTMLNRELRPFLSKWHPRLLRFEADHPGRPDSEWPEHSACREELREVQRNLYVYAVGFARLAGVRDAEEMIRLNRSAGA